MAGDCLTAGGPWPVDGNLLARAVEKGAGLSQDFRHTEKTKIDPVGEGFLSLMRGKRTTASVLLALAALALCASRSRAQAALLMEEPYGFFGALNPTGHAAIYFERICAETPVRLRRCAAGELGSVISRYQGIDGYDWVAMPLVPYLYSVESASEVPARVDRKTVERMRDEYREAHLLSLGESLPSGGFTRGGWTQLVGVVYERRTYAFRFETTPEQDDAFIARMNSGRNRSHFELFLSNCADFARVVLNAYFPGVFRRSVFPDAGITTPKQIAYKLVKYARKHPELQLRVLEVPQIPGYRRRSHSNKSIAESLTTTAYAVPITLVNPYLAGGLFVDYLSRGLFHSIPRRPPVLEPGDLSPLTASVPAAQNPESAGAQAPGAAVQSSAQPQTSRTAGSGLREMKVAHE